MTENVLVVGAVSKYGTPGFIGSHFVDLLGQDKQYRIKLFEGDITDQDDIVRNLRNVDTVVNFAALTYVPASWDTPHSYSDVNFGGVINFMRNCSMFTKFIHTSTATIYGNQPTLPVSVNTLPLPGDPYSVSKVASEQIVRAYSTRFGFKHLIIRQFNVFGPRQSKQFVIPTFCIQALKDKRIVVRGNSKREFIFVKDNVRVIKGLMDDRFEGTFQIAKGKSTEVMEMAKIIGQIADAEVVDGSPLRQGYDISEIYGAPDSVPFMFDWTPLNKALAETLDSYRD